MEIEKNDARVLMAMVSGRVGAAKQSVSDLEGAINDLKIKLDRANAELDRAEAIYAAAQEILENETE